MGYTFPQPISYQIWNEKYRLITHKEEISDDATVEDTWKRIAQACADSNLELNDGFTYTGPDTDFRRQRFDEFMEALTDFNFLPAGRVTAGAGSGRNVTLFNCYVMGTIPDNLSGIFQNLKEAALTMQQGGGIGYDFSPLRPKDSPVKHLDADASGPLSFMDVWDAMCRTIMSAGSRRGAMMATMICTHPDIERFITAKHDLTKLRMFNVSVMATDDFMTAVRENKDWALVHKAPPADISLGVDKDGNWIYRYVNARDLWNLIMENTYNHAEPGVLFIERINKQNNLWYCETISSTNPCFVGNQTILTDQGPKTFLELEGQRVSVLTENQAGKLIYRPMDVFKTAKDQKILRVTLDDGTIIDCTHTHEFFDLDRNRVEARDLIPGQRLASVYRHNANSKGYKRLTNGIDNPLEHHVPFEIIPDGFHVHHKNEIKDDNRPENLELIHGSDHNSYHMQGNKNPSITHPENNKLIHMDHSGSNNGRYRDDLADTDLQEMRKQGMSYIAIAEAIGCSKYTVMKRLGYERPNHKVVSVEPLMDRQDVFCGTVDETHRFFLGCKRGGVLVSNCGEQPLPPYGACLLGSLNLTQFVVNPFTKNSFVDWDKLELITRYSVRMLDAVIDISNFPLPEQLAEAKAKRRMGIGITGLADLFLMMNVRYGSKESAKLAERIMQTIFVACYDESAELAKLLGPCSVTSEKEDREKYLQGENIKKLPKSVREKISNYGIRNSHLTSIAPTGTISLYAGNISSGGEPIFAGEYTRKVLNPDGTKREELVEDYAVRMYRQMYPNNTLPQSFVTAQTLKPMDHLVIQASLQKWVDSSISKTVNLPKDISMDDFQEVYMQAYDMGCKGCTTYRPNDVTGSILEVKEDKPKEVVQTKEEPVQVMPLKRPEVLQGQTYKLRWQNSNVYMTVNNYEENGKLVPFEIFINTKEMTHFQWTVALTRMISAIFRRGGDISFVTDELKSVFDPNGGAFTMGRYVPSFIALLGITLENHLRTINYQEKNLPPINVVIDTPTMNDIIENAIPPMQCPSCKEFSLVSNGGCPTCTSCGYSKC